MALPRKKWNNIIIIAAIAMISILTFLDKKTAQLPDDASALFDESAPLAQLQFDGVWLNRTDIAADWQCDLKVLNCQQWAEAWQQVKISPIATPESPISATPKKLIIQIQAHSQAQVWQYITEYGLLSSPAGNWYEIPPSLRGALLPVIKAEPIE